MTKRLGVLLSLLATACTFATVVRAQNTETAKWATVDGWEIRVDRTLSDGCFAMAVYERGTVARIGVDPQSNSLYIFVGHDNWKSLEIGKIYPVKITFDGAKPYDGEMKGVKLGNLVFLAHTDLSTNFVKDFMQRNTMDLYYRGEAIAKVSLKGTYAAFQEVLNCQKEFGFSKQKQTPPDPFVNTQPSRKDPFR